MKRALYILFAMFFTVITVGVSISKHYTGNELYSFSIYGEAESCCEIPCNCCDNEFEFIQFTAEYLNATQENLDHKNIILDLLNSNSFSLLLSSADGKEIYRVINPIYSHPPRESAVFLAEVQAFLL